MCGNALRVEVEVGGELGHELAAVRAGEATVAHCSVTEVQKTSSSGHSVCSHSSSQASTRAAPPEVVLIR